MEGLIKHSMEGLIGQETAPTMIPAAPPAEVVEKKKLNVVVVAVDDSEGSHYALSWAIDRIISSRRDDSQLVVLYAQHAVDIFADPVAGHYPLPYAPAAAYTPTSVFESMKKANEENSKRIIARAVDICKSKGVNATTAIVEGELKDALCDAAEQLHADLLVVGSRGLGMLKRAFLGSVSDYVVHHAKCPVLIVKPPKGTPKQKS